MHIGIAGIGLMGSAFVERLCAQGHMVRVFNRTKSNIKGLIDSGIEACDSVENLIELSDTIILMLSDADAIIELLHIDEPAEQRAQWQGKTLLQMATISPEQSRKIGRAVTSRGAGYLEAPVLGSIPEAIDGTLIIMAAGDKKLFDDNLPLLKVLGNDPRYIGEIGTAAALKLSMNQLIASLTAGFSLSLGYAIKNGVDTTLFMDTVRESALYAKTYDKKLDKYLSRDFGTANFSTRHLLKDIRLFIEDARAAGLDTDALEGIERITNQSVEDGLALMDYSSIFQTICPKS